MSRYPTPEKLRDILRYDPTTGMLTWRKRSPALFKKTKHKTADHLAAAWNARFANRPALRSICGSGYLTGGVFGQILPAHRVCWAIYHGRHPVGQIDHINHNRTDNRIENLRDVSHAENARNQVLSSNNKSGITGVYADRRTGMWNVQIRHEGKVYRLGVFPTVQEAADARQEANRRFGYHENHGKSPEALKLIAEVKARVA